MEQETSYRPLVSVIINTDGRAKALPATLDGLARLKYDNFEVCIVYGPTPDGTREYVQSLGNRVKSAHCPVRNLSQSRNMGIALAAGEIVAFIDDDGVPEPEWLDELVVPFADPDVGGAGGLVYDHTGYSFQYLYAGCDRLGNAIIDLKEPCSDWNYPLAARFPYVQGTNSAFRRSQIIEVGGFDEEYEFYLDETDVCCRMVDAGFTIAQLSNARVHHKFLPSHIRNEGKVTVYRYAVIKNKIYFSLINNKGHHPINHVIQDAVKFVNGSRDDLEFHFRAGRVDSAAMASLETDIENAWTTGLVRGLSGSRRTQPPVYFETPPAFQPYPTIPCAGARLTIVLLSQAYPPCAPGGNARHTYDIARGLAALGHTVHVLTKSPDVNRVDLEEGVWVHRIVPRHQPPRVLPDGQLIPGHVWNHSATMLEETYRISHSRNVDVVEGVSWDCETAAFILDGKFPVATNVVTSLSNWLSTHEDLANDEQWMQTFGRPMLALERIVFEQSDRVIAASQAILDSLSDHYDINFAAERIVKCVHGLEDMSLLPRKRPAALPKREDRAELVTILFVGRLELRKGIDMLLAAAGNLLERFPNVQFWIAGDDSLALDGGKTGRETFLESPAGSEYGDRVYFLGATSEEELRWLYGNCDIFAAPSRFESFGLVLVEAMMFSKPVVAGRAGGMVEIISDGENGLLVKPGDSQALETALQQLIENAARRRQIGEAGRAEFNKKYALDVVGSARAQALATIRRSAIHPDRLIIDGDVKWVEIDRSEKGLFLGSDSSISFNGEGRSIFMHFFTHHWSGIVDISVDGAVEAQIDLYSVHPGRLTYTLGTAKKGSTIAIARKGNRRSESHSDETIIAQILEAVQ